MPLPSFTALLEGVDYNAVSLNSRFSGILGGINSITTDGPREKAFRKEHFVADTPFVPWRASDGGFSLTSPAGNAVTVSHYTDWPPNTANLHVYTNQYISYSSDTVGAPGWAIIGSADPARDNLQITFQPIAIGNGTGTDNIGGILVLLNVFVHTITGVLAPLAIDSAAITLQIQVGGAWYTLRKATRIIHNQTVDDLFPHTCSDAALRVLIRQDEVTSIGGGFPAGTEITGVRAMVAVIPGTFNSESLGTYRRNPTPLPGVSLQGGRMTVIPLYSEYVV